MEGEREEQGESTQSGTTSSQAYTLTQSCIEESDAHQNVQEPEEDDQAEIGACNGEVEPSQVGEDLCISDAESLPQETLIATNTQDVADCLPLSPMPTEEELTPLQCHLIPPTHKEDSGPLSPTPSSGQRVSYQTDPRPHFGVAWSSHSTCRPLWGSEGPCWGQRNQDMPDQTHTCPHCHLGLTPDTLRWHEAKCLLFEGVRNPEK